MTLDLLKLGADLSRMGVVTKRREADFDTRRQRAHELLQREWDITQLGELARRSNRRLGTPLEPLDTVHAVDPAPADHRVIATDGSQIEPQRHGIADYYLINIGWAAIDYGTDAVARLDSHPSLFYELDDLYIREGDRRVMVTEQHLGARRAGFELRAALELALELADERPTVVLADGTLLLWVLEDRPGDFLRGALLRPYVETLAAFAESGIPLASYTSRPRHAEVTGLLREATCRGQASQCETCAGAVDRQCGLDGLPDRELFDQLAPGQRSGRFEVTLQGSLKNFYGANIPQFFYANVGSEVVRVEVPPYTGNDPARLALVHAVVQSQVERGLGYPTVLARAHEQAVVAAPDRAAFLRVLDQALTTAGVRARSSQKQLAKDRKAV